MIAPLFPWVPPGVESPPPPGLNAPAELEGLDAEELEVAVDFAKYPPPPFGSIVVVVVAGLDIEPGVEGMVMDPGVGDWGIDASE